MSDDAYRSPLLGVRRTVHRGRGVFATRDIPGGTLLERAPVLVVPADEVLDHSPALRRYAFDWRGVAGGEHVAIALGLGSLYNHDWPANAAWNRVAPDWLEIAAHGDIPAGREITINYRGEPNDPEVIDFAKID